MALFVLRGQSPVACANHPSGSIFCLRNKAALERANITHVVSVLRLKPSEETFSSYAHHSIDIDDIDDENLLEHLPATIKFIQTGLDAGGSVLIHWWVSPYLFILRMGDFQQRFFLSHTRVIFCLGVGSSPCYVFFRGASALPCN